MIVLVFDIIAKSIEYIGMAIIAIAAFVAAFKLITSLNNLPDLRKRFGERILTGLEFIIAGELLLVTLKTDFEDLVSIAVIVGIRAVLGFILKKEISN
jgi:uncharacterized membrane protein